MCDRARFESDIPNNIRHYQEWIVQRRVAAFTVNRETLTPGTWPQLRISARAAARRKTPDELPAKLLKMNPIYFLSARRL